MQNATAAPVKRSSIEKRTNEQILLLFTILLALALVSSLGSIHYLSLNTLTYVYPTPPIASSVISTFFLNILTFIILFNNLIPISLIVTMEVVKLQLSQLIQADLDIYDVDESEGGNGGGSTVVRTSSLVEELGQIQYGN